MLLIAVSFFILSDSGQKKPSEIKSTEGYKFTPVVEVKATSVKNQAGTGTCWCFATISFLESELLRTGKGEYDLSEMWIVRNNYVDRLRDNFVLEGKGNLGEGSLPHDCIIEMGKNGLVPDEIYTGLNYSLPNHYHGELNAMINAVGKVAVDRHRESDQYMTIVNDILDTYLGKSPDNFTYKGVGYTPRSFARSLGLNPDDYVELTSFTFIPFYKPGVVPVPDNWRKASQYNLPLDELMSVIDYALNHGYSVDWDGDVSEKGFSSRNAVAIIPEVEKTDNYSPAQKNKYGKMTVEERTAEAYKFDNPFPEASITQEIREKGYDDKSTTDDHSMHITGISKDQAGNKYYITKNSWGPSNKEGGYLNMSESYVRAKTILILVHKDAIPAEVKTKLGI